MTEDDFYQEYQAQRLEFIHRYQQECWTLWFNRFILQGIPVEQAKQKTKQIVEDWTGKPMNFEPFVLENEIDF
ncbi:hypothetical protein BV378_20310 [Nostoc sp. RF31YmG]|jgi:hypothetical protein|nr:hypothetical protein BV378_20310 [Nostoc sp. RF31YmG]